MKNGFSGGLRSFRQKCSGPLEYIAYGLYNEQGTKFRWLNPVEWWSNLSTFWRFKKSRFWRSWKKISTTTFDKNFVAYTRVYKLQCRSWNFCSVCFWEITSTSWGHIWVRSVWGPSEVVNRNYQSQSGLKEDYDVWISVGGIPEVDSWLGWMRRGRRVEDSENCGSEEEVSVSSVS